MNGGSIKEKVWLSVEKMDNIYRKLLAGASLIFFIFIGFGVLSNMSDVYKNSGNNKSFFLLSGVISTFLLLGIVYNCFKMIEKISEKKQWIITIVLFLILSLGMLILWNLWHISPSADSFDDIDEAYYLLYHPRVMPDSIHINTIGPFYNNYLFILILKNMMRLFLMAGITDFVKVLYLFNFLCILCAVLFAWCSLYLCCNIKSANKFLLFCVFNPVYYALVFWIYTATVSLPIMMGLILIAILIKRSRSWKKRIGFVVIEGLLLALGYEIRPTSIFPFLAMVALFVMILKKFSLQRSIFCGAILLFVLFAFFSVTSKYKDRYFSEIYPLNYPISHWFCMGSHGDGNLSAISGEDVNYYMSFEDAHDRNKAGMELTLNYYKENGIAGTINLWYRKMINTWSDGYSFAEIIRVGQTEGQLYQFIAGYSNLLWNIYSLSFHLLVIGLICIYSVQTLKQDFARSFVYDLALVTIFGGIVFYMIWEAKNIYYTPFLLCMMMIAQKGMDFFSENVKENSVSSKKEIIFPAIYIIVFLVIVCNFIGILKDGKEERAYLINSTNNTRVNQVIPYRTNSEIQQTIHLSKDSVFNTIELMTSIDCTDHNMVSDYSIRVCDLSGNTITKRTAGAEDIEDGIMRVRFDDIRGSSDYVIRLKKLEREKEDILFFFKNSYYIKLYDGVLSSGDLGEIQGRLTMNIAYVKERILYHGKSRWLLLAIGIFSIVYGSIGLCKIFPLKFECNS